MEYREFLKRFFDEKFIDELLNSISLDPISGLRVNINKIPPKSFLNCLDKHPIINNCFLFDKKINPLGKHIYHSLGCYYIQEPSAMLVGHILDVKENDNILDMCAAPGGKSTFVGQFNSKGILVSNDINFSRSLDLLENIERMGIKNCFVLNEKTENIVNNFYGYFDKVILDAPCSGEGMFRKNELVKEDWDIDKVNRLTNIQKKLIIEAYNCLKNGGVMVYSTCTFNCLENEEIIKYLLDNTNASLINIDSYLNIDRGINMPEAIRIFPNHFNGEGHFICLIKCNDDHINNTKKFKCEIDQKSLKIFKDFSKESLNIDFDKSNLFLNKEKLYFVPNFSPDFKNLNVLKYGLYLGEIKDKYFIPSHHLASSLKPSDWKIVINLDSQLDTDKINKYIKGETLNTNLNVKGYGIISVDNIPLGLIKINNGIIKNYYPKKLRK